MLIHRRTRTPISEGFLRGASVGAGAPRDPHAGRALLAPRGDPEGAAHADDGLLEQAHVVVQPEVEQVKIDDRIDGILARAVVGDVAPAVGLLEPHAHRREHLARGASR